MSSSYELDTFVNDTILKRWSAVRRKLIEVSNFALQYHITRRMNHSKIIPLKIATNLFILSFFVQHAEGPLILYRKEEDKKWCLMQCQEIFEAIRVALVFLQNFQSVSRLEFIAREYEINIQFQGVLDHIENRIVAIEKKVYDDYPTLCKRTREEYAKIFHQERYEAAIVFDQDHAKHKKVREVLRAMQVLGLEEKKNFAVNELSSLTGVRPKEFCIKTSQTSWLDDEYTLGSYSYAKVGGSQARVILQEPVEEKLYFAGEAISQKFYSTMHGAFASGEKAALKFIDYRK